MLHGSQNIFGRRERRRLRSIFRRCLAESTPQRPLAPADIQSAVARLRKQFLAEFDPVYVENVIVPHFLVSVYDGERPTLPMIGEELTKETAPFGFGYRRCPGEQLTIQVFEDFLRKVWKSKIEFSKLDIANPEPLPIGPATVIGDNVGFTRSA